VPTFINVTTIRSATQNVTPPAYFPCGGPSLKSQARSCSSFPREYRFIQRTDATAGQMP
jgi:hypothetical protein